jgi:hypothetical protein
MKQMIDSAYINPILISQSPSGSTQQHDPDESCPSRNQIGFPQTKISVSAQGSKTNSHQNENKKGSQDSKILVSLYYPMKFGFFIGKMRNDS